MTLEAWSKARQALRRLRTQRAFTATVVPTIGLGVAACTAIFSLGYGILARPFPYRDPGHLVRVQTVTTEGAGWASTA